MTDYTVIRSRRRTMALEVTREGAALAHQLAALKQNITAILIT